MDLDRADGVGIPGVLLPEDADGVTRPLLKEGVMRPFDIDIDGVLRPAEIVVEAEGVILPDCDSEGVILPLREEATDEGRDV